MLKKRIIPKFLLRGNRLVKGLRFHDNFREAGNPVTTAKVYDSYGVDEMMFLDIDATQMSASPMSTVLAEVSEHVFMPITAGGGVRHLSDVYRLLRDGADKVAVNTIAVEDPTFVRRASRRFGDQCITVSIDYLRRPDGSHRVFTRGGTEATDLDPLVWASTVEEQGCGEIVLTSIDRDGTGAGYDLDLISRAAERLTVPLIASSGAGSLEHCLEAFEAGASAIAISTLFLFSDHSPIKVRSHLWSNGVPVRASKSSRS